MLALERTFQVLLYQSLHCKCDKEALVTSRVTKLANNTPGTHTQVSHLLAIPVVQEHTKGPSSGLAFVKICDSETEGKTNDWTWIYQRLPLDSNIGEEISNFRKNLKSHSNWKITHTGAHTQALIEDKMKLSNASCLSILLSQTEAVRGGTPPPTALLKSLHPSDLLSRAEAEAGRRERCRPRVRGTTCERKPREKGGCAWPCRPHGSLPSLAP